MGHRVIWTTAQRDLIKLRMVEIVIEQYPSLTLANADSLIPSKIVHKLILMAQATLPADMQRKYFTPDETRKFVVDTSRILWNKQSKLSADSQELRKLTTNDLHHSLALQVSSLLMPALLERLVPIMHSKIEALVSQRFAAIDNRAKHNPVLSQGTGRLNMPTYVVVGLKPEQEKMIILHYKGKINIKTVQSEDFSQLEPVCRGHIVFIMRFIHHTIIPKIKRVAAKTIQLHGGITGLKQMIDSHYNEFEASNDVV